MLPSSVGKKIILKEVFPIAGITWKKGTSLATWNGPSLTNYLSQIFFFLQFQILAYSCTLDFIEASVGLPWSSFCDTWGFSFQKNWIRVLGGVKTVFYTGPIFRKFFIPWAVVSLRALLPPVMTSPEFLSWQNGWRGPEQPQGSLGLPGALKSVMQTEGSCSSSWCCCRNLCTMGQKELVNSCQSGDEVHEQYLHFRSFLITLQLL